MAKTHYIFLNLLKSLSPQKIANIIAHFDDPGQIYKIDAYDLSKIPFLTNADMAAIQEAKKNKLLDRELDLITQNKIHVIDCTEEIYPALLKEIPFPPIVLYVKGDISVLNKLSFAVVGTRIPTAYGLTMAADFSQKLATSGFVIVSGLARGIDTVVHQAAIQNGKTVAVLGSGLLHIYPRENKKLSEQVAACGALVSEFPLNEPPLRENFPRRNRIISGLSRGVLVIEAAIKSGALITAHTACDQNRNVYALPGRVDSPLSKGTHLLLKEGARLVECVDDILGDFDQLSHNRSDDSFLSRSETEILALINNTGICLEEILLQSKMEQSLLNQSLINLQLKGLICEVKPLCFMRI